MAASSTNGIAMFGGGRTDSSDNSFSEVIDVYSITTRHWTKTALSDRKCCLDAVGWKDWIIFSGGKTIGDQYSGQFEVFDVNTNESFIPSIQLLVPRAYHTSVVTRDGELYIAGGEISGGALTDLVEVYSLSYNQITLLRTFNISIPRRGLAGAILQQSYTEAQETESLEETLVVFAGGQTLDEEAIKTVDIYDRLTGALTVDNMQESRSYFKARSMPGYIVFAGGETSNNKIEFWDGEEWTHSAILFPRRGMASVAIGDLVMYGGGITSANYSTNAVDVFTTDMLIRGETSSLTMYLSSARNTLAAVTVRDPNNHKHAMFMFAGGKTNYEGGASSVVDIIEITWMKFPSEGVPVPYPIFSTILIALLLTVLALFSLMSLGTCHQKAVEIKVAFGTISSLSALPGSFLYTWLLYSTLAIGMFLAFITIQELAANPFTPTLHLAWSVADLVAAIVFSVVGLFHSKGGGGVTKFDCGPYKIPIHVSDTVHGISSAAAFAIFAITNFSFGVYLVSLDKAGDLDKAVLALACVEVILVVLFLVFFVKQQELTKQGKGNTTVTVKNYALKRNIRISATDIMEFLKEVDFSEQKKSDHGRAIIKAINDCLSDNQYQTKEERKAMKLKNPVAAENGDAISLEIVPSQVPNEQEEPANTNLKKTESSVFVQLKTPTQNPLNLPLFCTECLLVFFTVLVTAISSFRYNISISWFK
jgi:hypothetical protein